MMSGLGRKEWSGWRGAAGRWRRGGVFGAEDARRYSKVVVVVVVMVGSRTSRVESEVKSTPTDDSPFL